MILSSSPPLKLRLVHFDEWPVVYLASRRSSVDERVAHRAVHAKAGLPHNGGIARRVGEGHGMVLGYRVARHGVGMDAALYASAGWVRGFSLDALVCGRPDQCHAQLYRPPCARRSRRGDCVIL